MNLNNLNTALELIGACITVIGGLVAVVTYLFSRHKNKKKIIALTLVVTLVGGGLLWHTLDLNAGKNTWTTKVEEFSPYCDGNFDETWDILLKDSTHTECDRLGLLMTSPSVAEIDLKEVKGDFFNSRKLDMQVQITFRHDRDPNTFAGFTVSTIGEGIGEGGYTLLINNIGYWRLGDTEGQRHASGSLASSTSIVVEMKMQPGMIVGIINQKQVFRFDDNLSPSVVSVGFLLKGEYSSSPPSPVHFSNFILKV